MLPVPGAHFTLRIDSSCVASKLGPMKNENERDGTHHHKRSKYVVRGV